MEVLGKALELKQQKVNKIPRENPLSIQYWLHIHVDMWRGLEAPYWPSPKGGDEANRLTVLQNTRTPQQAGMQRFCGVSARPIRLSSLQTRSFNSSPGIRFISFETHILVLQSSKETRQGRYVKQLLALGVDYKGSLSEAKSTLNRFLRNDARIWGLYGTD